MSCIGLMNGPAIATDCDREKGGQLASFLPPLHKGWDANLSNREDAFSPFLLILITCLNHHLRDSDAVSARCLTLLQKRGKTVERVHSIERCYNVHLIPPRAG